MYVADEKLTCLSVQIEDTDLWYKKLGHQKFSLLKKLISKALDRGIPKFKFQVNKALNVCVGVITNELFL